FKGDGDFRSKESIELLKQADIVVTNPPFSLFREYVAQLTKYDKKFLIIGNINAITYKEIFKLIKENKAWLGINLGRGISGFIVPEHYELYGTEVRIDSLGNRIVSPNNCLWLTNLDTSKRHEDIELTKQYFGNEIEYPKYDNYNGINVDKTQDIPIDYAGFMGVPITFLHKFNPDQFEIIKFRKGYDGKDLSVNGKCPYFRILIRNKRIQSKLFEKEKSRQVSGLAQGGVYARR
ncbi:MAG: adenine-specific methyltransferase EcoRI family protein, partial [Bacteroidales bacterium]|nr:adenine-specific methyltransferase EcoRI family protein [Bacteroidales bacterium]